MINLNMTNKYFVLLIPLVFASSVIAQKKEFKDDVYSGKNSSKIDFDITPELLNIPIKDGQIFYEQISEASGTQRQLYMRARKWFVDHFHNANSVLQYDDKEDGKLMGKAFHVYDFESGVSTSKVSIYFTLNIDLRDNRYRIQFYDMYGSDKKTNQILQALAAVSASLSTMQTGYYQGMEDMSQHLDVNYNEVYNDFLDGRRKKYNGRMLYGMSQEVASLFESFDEELTTEYDEF